VQVVLFVANNVDLRRLVVQAWTSQCDNRSADGSWHAVDLLHMGSDDTRQTADETVRHVVYGQSVIITSDRDFEFTFRVNVCH